MFGRRQWLKLPAWKVRDRPPLWHSSFKEAKVFLTRSLEKSKIMGSLSDREVACSALDRKGSNFESCVCRAVSSHLFHNPHMRFPWYGLVWPTCAQRWPKTPFIPIYFRHNLFPSNTKNTSIVVLKLGQRCRPWASIQTTLGQLSTMSAILHHRSPS